MNITMRTDACNLKISDTQLVPVSLLFYLLVVCFATYNKLLSKIFCVIGHDFFFGRTKGTNIL